MQPIHERISRNTLILLTSQASTAGLAFLLTVILARGLGDVGLGRYATIMAWVLPLSLVADFGLSTWLTREIAAQRGHTHDYLRRAWPIRASIAGGLVGGVWLGAPWLLPGAGDELRLAAPLILIDTLFGTYTAAWRAWERTFPILVLNAGLLAAQTVGAAVIIHQGGGLMGVIAVLVIADAGQLACAWVWWRVEKLAQPGPRRVNLPSGERLLRAAWPFAVAGLLGMVQLRAPVLLMQAFQPAEAVGWYAGAARFAEAARLPIMALFGAVFPALSAIRTDRASQQLWRRRLVRGLLIYGVALGGLFVLLGEQLLGLAFGAAFRAGGPALAILGGGLAVALLRQHAIIFLYINGYEARVNWALALGLGVQVVAGLVWVPLWGAAGAALSLLMGEGVMLIWLRGLQRRDRQNEA
ncbi:MAG: lipopolysaccharide biosynthesis protein [Anaerolineales bacterium]